MSLKMRTVLVLVLIGCTSSYEGGSEASTGGRVASAVARLTADSEACLDEARACYGESGACELSLGAFVGCSEAAGCGGWEGVELTCAEVSCLAEYDALSDCYVEADACRAFDACWVASTMDSMPEPAPEEETPADESRACLAEATACYGPSAPCEASLSELLGCSDAAGCETRSIELACLEAACEPQLAIFEACYFDSTECRDLDTCGEPSEPSPSEPSPSEPSCAEEDDLCTREGGACAATIEALIACAREVGCEDESCFATECTALYTDYTLCTLMAAECRPALDCRLEASGPLDTCSEAAVACYFGGPCVEEYAAAYVSDLGGALDEELVDALSACELAQCPDVTAACGG